MPQHPMIRRINRLTKKGTALLLHRRRLHPLFTQCRRPHTAPYSAAGWFHISPLLRGKDIWRHVVTPLSWSLFGILVATDMIWLSLSPLKFPTSNLWIIGGLSLGFVLWIVIFRVIFYRLKDDMSHLASALRGGAHRGELFVRALAFTTFFGWAGGAYLCLATSMALPLQDATLASLDQMLHFDWLAFLALTNSSPIVSWSLVVAYHSAFPQMVLLYILLSFSRREEQLAEFLTLFCFTFVATCFLMLLVPAAGAYPYYQPRRELFDRFSGDAGMWHYEVFTLLRTEPAPVLKLEHMKGLVTFPSFHTSLAVITAYAARSIPFIALPAVILNGFVIVSTLPEGGHFLVDVLAGAIVALVGITLVRWRRSAGIVKCRSSFRPDLGEPTSRSGDADGAAQVVKRASARSSPESGPAAAQPKPNVGKKLER